MGRTDSDARRLRSAGPRHTTCVEERPQPVVLEPLEAVAATLDALHRQVQALGGTVRCAGVAPEMFAFHRAGRNINGRLEGTNNKLGVTEAHGLGLVNASNFEARGLLLCPPRPDAGVTLAQDFAQSQKVSGLSDVTRRVRNPQQIRNIKPCNSARLRATQRTRNRL